MAKYVASLDQGTTSTRCMLFDHGGKVVSVAQKEHEQALLVRYAKAGPPEDAAQIAAPIEPPERDAGTSADDADSDERAERPLTFAY